MPFFAFHFSSLPFVEDKSNFAILYSLRGQENPNGKYHLPFVQIENSAISLEYLYLCTIRMIDMKPCDLFDGSNIKNNEQQIRMIFPIYR